VVRLVQLLFLRPPGHGGPAGGGGSRGGAAAAARRGERHREGAAGELGALAERPDRVVPAAQPRLVLERLDRAHARSHNERRSLLAHLPSSLLPTDALEARSLSRMDGVAWPVGCLLAICFAG
jgi:hypothetical protein